MTRMALFFLLFPQQDNFLLLEVIPSIRFSRWVCRIRFLPYLSVIIKMMSLKVENRIILMLDVQWLKLLR